MIDQKKFDNPSFWKSYADETPDFICFVNFDGKIEYLNRTLPEYGSPESFRGVDFLSFVLPEFHERTREGLKKAFQGETDYFENVTYSSDKRNPDMLTWFLNRTSPLYVDGKIVGASFTAFDLTERKAYEKKIETINDALEDSNEKLDHFVSDISHDLKSPLRIITNYVDRLKRFSESEKNLKYLKKIENASKKMSQMIDSLLEISRVTSKGGSFELVPLAQIQKEVERFSEEFEIITYFEGFDQREIKIDRPQIARVFQNLCENALKYKKRGEPCTVKFKVLEKAGFYKFSVKDSGKGFEQKYEEEIFKPFSQLDRNTPGDGSGLAICKKIVERHLGTIGAIGEIGKGSTFWFTLPIPTSHHFTL